MPGGGLTTLDDESDVVSPAAPPEEDVPSSRGCRKGLVTRLTSAATFDLLGSAAPFCPLLSADWACELEDQPKVHEVAGDDEVAAIASNLEGSRTAGKLYG